MAGNETHGDPVLHINNTWTNFTNINMSSAMHEIPRAHHPYSLSISIINCMKYYFTPSLITLGFLGNSISWLTLLRSKLRSFSSSHYLVALCIVNNIYLLNTLLKWLSIHGVEIHSRPGLCQGISFVENSAIFLSNWYIVAFCTDRYIALCWPTEGIRLCSKVRARTVITALCIISTVIYINISVTKGVVVINDRLRCRSLPFFYHNLQLLAIIMSVLNVILPYLCIIFLCLLLIINIYVMHIRDVFSDDNSPSLLKQTTFVYMLLFFLLHTPYELYYLNHIFRGIVSPQYIVQTGEFLAQAFLMHVFNLSMAIHLPVYLCTYPLFRNYLKQNWLNLWKKCAKQNNSKPRRSEIEFTGVKQVEESAV